MFFLTYFIDTLLVFHCLDKKIVLLWTHAIVLISSLSHRFQKNQPKKWLQIKLNESIFASNNCILQIKKNNIRWQNRFFISKQNFYSLFAADRISKKPQCCIRSCPWISDTPFELSHTWASMALHKSLIMTKRTSKL